MITATTAVMTCEKPPSLSMVPLLTISMYPMLYSSALDTNTFNDFEKLRYTKVYQALLYLNLYCLRC